MKKLILAGLLAFTGAASAQTIIYDTFNEGDQSDLFDCCSFIPVDGPKSGSETAVAIPFVPPTGGSRTVRIKEIDVALSYSGQGADRFSVRLEGPAAGHPHRVRANFLLDGVALGGQCCSFDSLSASGVHTKAGNTYWIVISGGKDAMGGWNLNSIGAQGDYETWDGHAWHDASGLLPAVRITSE